MKKIVCLFILLFITEGYCQEFFNAYGHNIIVFKKIKEVTYLDRSNEYYKDLIYEDEDYSVTLNPLSGFPLPYKFFFLKKGEETMGVFCRGFGNSSYYIKNIEFKPGKYVLEHTFPTKYYEDVQIYDARAIIVYGVDINISQKVQDFQFLNYTSNVEKRADVYFKDIRFIEIDMNDTINVKLIEVEKFPPW